MLLKQFYKTPLLEMPESSDLITEDANNIYIYPITCDLLRNEASRIIWLLRLQEINIYILYQHKYLSTFIDQKKFAGRWKCKFNSVYKNICSQEDNSKKLLSIISIFIDNVWLFIWHKFI